MFNAKQGQGIVIRTTNKIGALADFSKVVARKGVRILAMSAWVEEEEAVIRFICEDLPRTMAVLRDSGYDPQERDVVLVEAAHQPGILLELADILAANNIDITHLFASAVHKNECLAVLNSSDNEQVVRLLNG
jgi:hypothetical protein